MKKRAPHSSLRRISSALAVSAAIVLPSPAGAERDVVTSATGSGQTTVAGEIRTFSFAAQVRADGTAVGVAQVNNRAVDEMFELRLNCLRTFGNTAIVSGVFIRHTDPHALGLTGVFAAVDSGEGAVASGRDFITQVFFFRPNTRSCADLVPADATPFLVPVEAGNVQIHKLDERSEKCDGDFGLLPERLRSA